MKQAREVLRTGRDALQRRQCFDDCRNDVFPCGGRKFKVRRTQQLLDRVGDQRRVGLQSFPLLRLTMQRQQPIADQIGRGLVPGAEQQADIRAQFLGAQPVARLLGLDELGRQVVARLAAAQAAVESYEAARDAIVTPGALLDLLVDACLLGFAIGQLVPSWSDAEQRIVRTLEPWPSSAVEYQRFERRWYVHTLDGRLPITPGDGQWVLYTPRGHRAPWLWGAIRCTAEWYLRDSETASDAARRSEVFGNAIWKAKLPSGGRKTPDGKSFAGSLRTMGRNAVIPCPQGATANESYDVELVEAQSDAHAIFEWLMRTGGGRIRLAILGQDLTSQNNTVGTNASSETGLTTLDRVVRAEGKAWGHCETEQIVRPRAAYLGEPVVRVCVEAEEHDERKADADAMKATADAVAAWRALGVTVNVDEMAQRARVQIGRAHV